MTDELELQDSPTPEEVPADEAETKVEEDNLSQDKNVSLEETNKRLFARAKKAEAELKALKQSPKEVPQVEKPLPEPIPAPDVITQKVSEVLDNRDLGNTGLPDDIQKEIKAYAKASGISIKKAMESDFYTFKKTKYEEAKKNDEASAGGGHGSPSRQEFSFEHPPKVDMTTEQGQKTWEEYKTWLKAQKA
jgi:hypothetical protein